MPNTFSCPHLYLLLMLLPAVVWGCGESQDSEPLSEQQEAIECQSDDDCLAQEGCARSDTAVVRCAPCEGEARDWYPDCDGDGTGAGDVVYRSCIEPGIHPFRSRDCGATEDNTDCDDYNPCCPDPEAEGCVDSQATYACCDNGACAQLNTDENCGACGQTCDEGTTCSENETCVSICGDALCLDGEDVTCPEDCQTASICGNGVCEPDEDSENCAQDCPAPPECGNGVCEPSETLDNCAQDCVESSVCGNGICESDEDSENCIEDCPIPSECGNGVCEPGETSDNCAQDCSRPETCGNNYCDDNETFGNCPEDCTCGDGVCSIWVDGIFSGEDSTSCPADCPSCEQDGDCPDGMGCWYYDPWTPNESVCKACDGEPETYYNDCDMDSGGDSGASQTSCTVLQAVPGDSVGCDVVSNGDDCDDTNCYCSGGHGRPNPSCNAPPQPIGCCEDACMEFTSDQHCGSCGDACPPGSRCAGLDFMDGCYAAMCGDGICAQGARLIDEENSNNCPQDCSP